MKITQVAIGGRSVPCDIDVTGHAGEGHNFTVYPADDPGTVAFTCECGEKFATITIPPPGEGATRTIPVQPEVATDE